MKNSLFIIMLTILLSSCATISKMSNETVYHAIVGQNETTVHRRLGSPARTIQTPGGGKKLVYELRNRGMFF